MKINLIGDLGGLFKITKTRSIEYVNNSPVQDVETDTGVDVNTLSDNAVYYMALIVEVDASEIQYILYSNVEGLGIKAVQDIRISKSAEFETGVGDVSFSFWVDSITDTIKYVIDVDAGGKTLIQAYLVGYETGITTSS